MTIRSGCPLVARRLVCLIVWSVGSSSLSCQAQPVVATPPGGCGSAPTIECLYGPYPYAQRALWMSGFGMTLADLDRDGWNDVIVTNGGDHAPQPFLVYHGQDTPPQHLPVKPTAFSRQFAYQGGSAAGDLDRDGWIDVVVAEQLGLMGEASKGGVRAFFGGPGSGGGSPLIDGVRIADGFPVVDVDLGDLDADGDLDLVVAVPGADHDGDGRVRIYLNRGGAFGSRPWIGAPVGAHAIRIADVDGDGWLDVAAIGRQAMVYFGSATQSDHVPFGPKPAWTSTDLGGRAWALDVAPIGCGTEAGVVAASEKGIHAFRVERDRESAPFWSNEVFDTVTDLALADLDGDGLTDLVTTSCAAPGDHAACRSPFEIASGRPQGSVALFAGEAGGFSRTPARESARKSFFRSVVLGELDHECVATIDERFEVDSPRGVVTLAKWPVLHVDRISIHPPDGSNAGVDAVTPPGARWIGFAPALTAGTIVEVTYRVSKSPEIVAVTASPQDGTLFYKSGLCDEIVHETVCPSNREDR